MVTVFQAIFHTLGSPGNDDMLDQVVSGNTAELQVLRQDFMVMGIGNILELLYIIFKNWHSACQNQ